MRTRIYIAGAITPTNKKINPVIEYGRNVKSFLDVAAKLIANGLAPFTPALDFLLLINDIPLTVDDFYELDFAFLEVCDAMYVIPNYENSEGVLNEIEFARKHHIPIYFNIDILIKELTNE